MNKLAQVRDRIDEIDRSIADLVSTRAALCQTVVPPGAGYVNESNVPSSINMERIMKMIEDITTDGET